MLVSLDVLWPVVCAAIIVDSHRCIVYVCVKAIELDILLLVGLVIVDFS